MQHAAVSRQLRPGSAQQHVCSFETYRVCMLMENGSSGPADADIAPNHDPH